MLHPETGAKYKVLEAIRNAEKAFSDNNRVVQEKLAEEFPNPVQREAARSGILQDLKQAEQEGAEAPSDSRWFTANTALSGLAQSAMNQRANQAEPVKPAGFAAAAAAAPAFAPLEKYGPDDPEWIECIIDSFRTKLEGKAKFIVHQNLTDFMQTIPDRVTIAIFGDWGAENQAARNVAQQIAAQHPDLLIHLGDIYYAGQRNEAQNVLAQWPIRNQQGQINAKTSYSLNGNHEMYSGGKAYFENILPAMGQTASYFGLKNSHWQLLGFDTAYVDHRLLPPSEATGGNAPLTSQWNWLLDKVQNSQLATLFLSHHQPVSAFQQENNEAARLRQDFDEFRHAAGRSIYGWFFGHEHRCTIYDDGSIPYLARLIGHGCIPHAAPPPNQQPDPGCYSFAETNTRVNSKGDAVSGFALLKFDGPHLNINYIDEDGQTFTTETWGAPE